MNEDIFVEDIKGWKEFLDSVGKVAKPYLDSTKITKLIYSAAIAFCCYIDLTKDGGQKTSGTFFEYLVGRLFTKRLGIKPTKQLDVLNLDIQATLPTDFIFNLGKEKPKFHLPVKRSSRESAQSRFGLTSVFWMVYMVPDDS